MSRYKGDEVSKLLLHISVKEGEPMCSVYANEFYIEIAIVFSLEFIFF